MKWQFQHPHYFFTRTWNKSGMRRYKAGPFRALFILLQKQNKSSGFITELIPLCF